MNKVASVIIGLGNHGNILSKPIRSRHSIGMIVCNALAEKYNQAWVYERIWKAYVAYLPFNDDQVILMKSKYPMNLNGRSLMKVVRRMEIPTSNILVLHDDLDRGFGKLSWKVEGSAGGHNGVKSVISSLQTDKFNRLRIGIGRPTSRDRVTDYVLGSFSAEEFENLEFVIENCMKEVENHIHSNIPSAADDVG